MCFREHRGRTDRSRAVVALLAATVILPITAVTRLTWASPIDDPFVGGMSFSGPTSGNLAAIYWNPAALGLARGLQIMVAGSGRLASVGATRAGPDPTTGAPFATAQARDLRQPFQWPPGPGSYFAISSGGDRVALGFATYMPYLEQIHFPTSPTGAEPNRYQVSSMDLRNLAMVPALAIRLGNELRIGLAPGILFSTGSLSFAEDTALDGMESPAAAARYNIASGQGIQNSKVSLTLGGGIYYRMRNLEMGLSYQSRPLGSAVAGVEVAGGQSSVTLPANGGGGPLTCAGGQSSRCVFGDVSYRLPDVFIGGITWHLRPGLELTIMERWLWMHVHDRIDIRLVGPSLEAARLPVHIVLYRGFHDVFDTRARIAYWWRERVRLGAELRIETSAVDTNAVNAAAVDGFKIEPVALIEVRVSRRFWLGAGYGLTIMPSVTVTNSIFDPNAAMACAGPGVNGDLANPDCQARNNGYARPSANGTYTSFAQDFGLNLNARF